MIEQEIKVPKETIVKGVYNSKKYLNFANNLKGIFLITFIMAMGIISLDIASNNNELVIPHLIFIVLFSLTFSIYSSLTWKSELLQETEDNIYFAKIDDKGVTIKGEELKIYWEAYQYYKEYDDYILIKLKDSGLTFLPKTKELEEVIEFTKSKIIEKC